MMTKIDGTDDIFDFDSFERGSNESQCLHIQNGFSYLFHDKVVRSWATHCHGMESLSQADPVFPCEYTSITSTTYVLELG